MKYVGMRMAVVGASLLLATAPIATTSAQSNAACPDGTLRFGVEPYEDAAVLAPAYPQRVRHGNYSRSYPLTYVAITQRRLTDNCVRDRPGCFV